MSTHAFKMRQKELEQTVSERTAEVVAQKEVVQKEKERSEELLLNILPAAVAEELKANGRIQPMHFEEVSILFARLQGVYSYRSLNPWQKIGQGIRRYFSAF